MLHDEDLVILVTWRGKTHLRKLLSTGEVRERAEASVIAHHINLKKVILGRSTCVESHLYRHG